MIRGEKKARTVYDTPTDEFEQIPKRSVLQIDSTFENLAMTLNDIEDEINSDENNPLMSTIDYIREKIMVAKEESADNDLATKQIIILTRGLIKALGINNVHSKILVFEVSALAERIGFKTLTY